MKRLFALVAGAAFLCATPVATAYAAKAAGAPATVKQQQGLKNAKKAMKSRLERDKKVREAQQKGSAKRQQAMGRK